MRVPVEVEVEAGEFFDPVDPVKQGIVIAE
jgi:hypothetical protein